MFLRVDYLVYFYMLLCACMLFFNLFYVGRNRWRQKRLPGRSAFFEKAVLRACKEAERAQGEDEGSGGTHGPGAGKPGVCRRGEMGQRMSVRSLRRRLKRTGELIPFQEALQNLLGKEESREPVRGWLEENRGLFATLGEAYLKKSQMEKAFFAWVVGSFDLCGESEEDPLTRDMLLLVQEASVYCRENALYAIYAAGSPLLVVRAYILMNRRRILHSRKMVTDGLLAFSGDREALAEELWENWELFDAHYQVAFIDFIRMVTRRFGMRFLRLIQSEPEREVKFAILRYYRKYRYPDAEKMLRGYVNNWCIDDWEFAAISALALEAYPGEKTVRALVRGIQSDAWHIRSNAADSLLRITDQERQQEILGRMEDSFGRNMLEYKIESLEKRKEAEHGGN